MSNRAIANGTLITAYGAGNQGLPAMDLRGHAQNVLVDANGVAQGDGTLLASATQSPYIVSGPGQWTILNAPAVNTLATVTKAAGGAGVRHVLQALTPSLFLATNANFTAVSPVYVVIRDGAAGAGTILYQLIIALNAAAASGGICLQVPPLNVIGSQNSSMTIEFTAAPGLTNFECISGSGYSISA